MSCLRDNNTRASSQGIEREAVAKLLMNLPPPSFKNIKKEEEEEETLSDCDDTMLGISIKILSNIVRFSFVLSKVLVFGCVCRRTRPGRVYFFLLSLILYLIFLVIHSFLLYIFRFF